MVVALAHQVEPWRPRTRRDCLPKGGGLGSTRPCPFVGCPYHLAIDVDHLGRVRYVREGLEVSLDDDGLEPCVLETMPQTCALDVADWGGATLREIGDLYDLSRERIRQLEVAAAELFRRRAGPQGCEELEAALRERETAWRPSALDLADDELDGPSSPSTARRAAGKAITQDAIDAILAGLSGFWRPTRDMAEVIGLDRWVARSVLRRLQRDGLADVRKGRCGVQGMEWRLAGGGER